MTTRVVNIRTLPHDPSFWPDGAVYIGRRARGGPTGWLEASPWANPFSIGVHGDRDEVVARFERWIGGVPHLMERLPELKDKTLVCWCAPARCHGDVLARLADAEKGRTP